MNDAKCNGEASRPEFQSILDDFRNELAKLDENSNLIMEKSCQLRDFREPIAKECEKEVDKGGVIGELENCLSRMRDYNNRLNDVRVGLAKIVG